MATLAIAIDGDSPPAEIRLFVEGWNDTENGRFLFDAEAAAAVMAAYQKHGVDRMIDLEHLSLESPESSVNYDPDARGWAKLELREDGSLWAVGVTWTPDGEARLREKRQRYVSPAFAFDAETKRITKVVNIAITALPATHGTPELVAASVDLAASAAQTTATLAAEGETNVLDPKMVAEALDAVTAGDAEKCIEILKGMIAAAASGGEAPPPEESPAEMADRPEDEPAAEMAAAASMLRTITGKASVTEALSEVQRLRAIAADVEAREAKLAAERAALERTERRDLVASLVKLGAAAPFVAWAEDADGLPDGRTPSAAFASMPIEKLRASVAKLNAGKGAPPGGAPKPPGAASSHGLSERELAMCRARKIDEAAYAAKKAAIAARSGRTRATEN